MLLLFSFFFFFQAEDGIRDDLVTGVQTCALPILVIVAQTPEVVEGHHLQVWPRESLWQFLANRVEDTDPCLFFDAFGQEFLCTLPPLLRRSFVSRDAHVHRTFVVLAEVEDRPCVPAIHKNGWFGRWAFAFL